MPSERFFKLNKEKQDRIVAACMDEFIRVGYKDASINQIIKDADISRGSFYTYFEDKTEIFAYIIGMLRHGAASIIMSTLKAQDGDLFNTCKSLIRMAISKDYEANDKVTQLFYSMLRDFDIMEHLKVVMENSSPATSNDTNHLERAVDFLYDNLNDIRDFVSREKFDPIADMLITMSIKSLVVIRKYPEVAEKEINTLFAQYDIIERGIRA